MLDPPALLSGVTVVIISPRKPVTVGTVARACGSFECEDLRIVMPRQESYLTRRHAKSASKGAQYILYRTGHYDSIAEATADCQLRVAFTRWVQHRSSDYVDIMGLPQHPLLQAVIQQPLLTKEGPDSATAHDAALPSGYAHAMNSSHATSDAARTSTASLDASNSDSDAGGDGAPSEAPLSTSEQQLEEQQQRWRQRRAAQQGPRVALIFGREELGMSDDEVASCELCCSIPIGRLQESLSLSHAVSIALCTIYQERLKWLAGGSSAAVSAEELSSKPAAPAGMGASLGPVVGAGQRLAVNPTTGVVVAW